MIKSNIDKDLVWRDLYEIGVDFIDNEHREILSILQHLGQAVNEANLGECAKWSDILINTVKLHFRHEENYLAKVGYPRLIEHKRYHEELLTQVQHVKEICEGSRENHSLKECFDAMEGFLIDDVLRGDINFKSFLDYNGYVSHKPR